MQSESYSDRAIPLVAVNQKTGKYEMASEAMQFLKSVPAPLGVVSVAGLYRTGKSYLLNKMLLNSKAKKGFGVGPTINPCTKGLWCWGTPIKGTSHTGESINIIVIDTEGIGALDEDQTHDTKIFTLAILASSCFIYNSVGSIDQTAVQNLSLIVNLTKHIQLKSSSKKIDEDDDADEIAHCFPTFYWVVRDFSLQLQDNQGRQITSKQYLEKALAPMKTSNQFDEEAEEKNKIRKLLTSFFRDRDCFTMVRPLVDETKLQDLDSIPFEQLRPDFIEQVQSFRKRVLNGLKIKALNNQNLNGNMYCNMLSSYVGAINEGAVPNIENAWNYMCQEQCQKVQDECEQIFDQELKDNLKLPVEEEYFESICENATEITLLHYRQKAVGDIALAIKYEKELKEKIKQKIKLTRQQNVISSKEVLQKKVLDTFKPIIEMLKKQQYQSFQDFEKVISTTYDQLVNSTPNLPFMRQKFLELYKKVQKQGAQYLFKSKVKQINNMKSIYEQKQNHFKKMIQDSQYQSQSDRKAKCDQIEKLDREKAQLKRVIEKLQFELEKTQKDKAHESETQSKAIALKNTEIQNMKKIIEQKLQNSEANYEQLNKKFNREQKQWEKNKSLMENNISQLTRTISELEESCKKWQSEYNQLHNQSSISQKEIINKKDKKISEMELQIRKLQDESQQQSENFAQIKKKLEKKIEKMEENQRRIKEELNSKKSQLQSMKNQWDSEKKKLQQELQDQRDERTRTKSTLGEDSKKQKEIINQMTEQIRKIKTEYDNKIAVYEQKIQFLDNEKSQIIRQSEQMKRIYERNIENIKIQSGEQTQERQKQRVEQVKMEFTTQITNIQVQFDSQKKQYIYELDTLRKENQEQQLNFKLTKDQLNAIKIEYSQFKEQMGDKIRAYEQSIKTIQRSKDSTFAETQKLLRQKIHNLERELQQMKQQWSNEVTELESQNRTALSQLRKIYEDQLQQANAFNQNLKKNTKREHAKAISDLENKLKSEIQAYEQEMQDERNQWVIVQQNHKSQVMELTRELADLNQRYKILENHYAELKQALKKRQQEFSRKEQMMNSSFKNQKDSWIKNNEQLRADLIERNNEIMHLKHEISRVNVELQKTQELLQEFQEKTSLEKIKFNEEIERLKKQNSELGTEFINQRVLYETKNAVLNQEFEYSKNKISELEKRYNQFTIASQDKLHKLKAQLFQQHSKQTAQLVKQRDGLQEKYDKLKKTSKQIQNQLNRQISEYEKEKAVKDERIQHLEEAVSNIEQKRIVQVSFLQKQLQKHKTLSKQQLGRISQQLSSTQQGLRLMSKEKIEIETKYEKDNLLLKNRVENEINNRKNREAAHQQAIYHLEQRLESLMQNKNSQQSKTQSYILQQKTIIEERYKNEISEYKTSLQKSNKIYNDLSRKTQYEIKDLRQRLALQVQNRQALQSNLNKKQEEWLTNQRNFTNEIVSLKKELENKNLQHQRILDNQKQILKIKINDLENKKKQVEKQANYQYSDFQKQRAKLNTQFNTMEQEFKEQIDIILKLENEKKKLEFDNQRLKAEKRNSRNASFIRVGNNLEQRKSAIIINTIRKEKSQKMEKRETEQATFQDEDKENISQQMLLD